jgi:hypothetical protein
MRRPTFKLLDDNETADILLDDNETADILLDDNEAADILLDDNEAADILLDDGDFMFQDKKISCSYLASWAKFSGADPERSQVVQIPLISKPLLT